MRCLGRHILTVCLLLVLAARGLAQEKINNFDYTAIYTMLYTYSVLQEEENGYAKNLREILELYRRAAAESLVVYESKKLERNALTDLNTWISSEELSYYSRIRTLVQYGILPKTLTIAGLCAREPHKLLYWGGYLSDISNHVLQLCTQMETVVLNSRLSYKDLPFLRFKDTYSTYLKPVFQGDSTFIAGMKEVAGRLADLSIEDIQDALFSDGSLSTYSSKSATYISKMTELMDNFESAYQELSQKDMLPDGFDTLSIDSVAIKLFDVISDAEYTSLRESLVGDYLSSVSRTCFTQMWHIERTSNQTKTRIDYNPDKYTPTGSHWVSFIRPKDNKTLTEEERQKVWQNSSKRSGLSNLDVNALRKQGYAVSESYTLLYKNMGSNMDRWQHFYAYQIKIQTSQVKNTIVYSEQFDSGEESEADFDARMQQVLKDYQKNQNASNSYRIIKDKPQYYTKTSDLDVKGMDRANVTVACSEDVSLEESGHKYTSKGDWKLEFEDANGNSEFRFLDDYIPDLLTYFRTGQTVVYGTVPKWPGLMEFNNMALESYDIIESQMNEWAVKYSLTWMDDLSLQSGSYNYNGGGTATFVRHARFNGSDTDVYTFEVKNKLNCDYDMGLFSGHHVEGVRFDIQMYLKAHLEEEHLYERIDLYGMDDASKARLVNSSMASARSEYPECRVDVTYLQTESTEDDSEDVIHLLWSSDRLNVARDVERQLVTIYTEMVAFERFMRQRLTLMDMVRQNVQLDLYKGQKKSKAEEARDRWVKNAKTVKITTGK